MNEVADTLKLTARCQFPWLSDELGPVMIPRAAKILPLPTEFQKLCLDTLYKSIQIRGSNCVPRTWPLYYPCALSLPVLVYFC